MGKRKRGRPSLYKPEYAKAIIRYFSIAPHFEKDITITKSDGTQIDKTEQTAADLPFFSDFAQTIRVNDDTLTEWVKKYPDFAVAYKRAKKLQEQILITNGLLGLYAPAFAIFTMKNICGWRDREEDKSPQTQVNVFINNIIQKAGINDTKREVNQGHSESKDRFGQFSPHTAG